MSQPPRNKPPVRQVSGRSSEQPPSSRSGGASNRGGAPQSQQPSRSGGERGRSGGYAPPPRDYRNTRPRNVQPQRDSFPYIMGGIIGALVVGLGLVIFLLMNNNKGVTGGVPVASATIDPNAPTVAAQATPPRMPIGEFKTLYDSANKPLIIDVRAALSFDEGHIAGAISFPEADADTRVQDIPKDKLVVAYCQ